jgi:D-lyxose ketol-isomerase
MKRSELNEIIREGERFIASFGFKLPEFASWSMDDWKRNKPRAGEVIRARLGWDITDFGRGDFENLGLLLFTVRNGSADNLKSGKGMVYAEKIMISRENQVTPFHTHKVKTEDIIVRGGAPLEVRLYSGEPGHPIDPKAPVKVRMDGIDREVPAGGVVQIHPGSSITLEPGHVHSFWGAGGDCLVGEVSTVNDDETDNYFLDMVSRFPDVEEDEPPYRLIVPDYAKL